MITYSCDFSFNTKHINCSLLYTKNYTSVYHVSYKRKPIYIQTPKLEILKIIQNDYMDSIMFQTLPMHSKIISFLNTIENLYNICKPTPKIKPIYNDQYLYGELHRHKTTNLYTVYNSNGELCSLEKIQPRYESIAIIILDSIWVKRNRMGFHWKIVQLKYYIPLYLRKCIIDNDDTDKPAINITHSQNTFVNHPKYSKFFKMLKMGIPKPSIIQKCNLENVNPICLNYNSSDIVPTELDIQILPTQSFSASDLLKCTLKKTIISPNKKKYKPKTFGFIPDIEQLLKIRNSLHKINKESNI